MGNASFIIVRRGGPTVKSRAITIRDQKQLKRFVTISDAVNIISSNSIDKMFAVCT